MAGPPDSYAALFETITGQSTVTERQRTCVAVRFDDGEARTVSEYLDGAVAADGVEDVIDDPEAG